MSFDFRPDTYVHTAVSDYASEGSGHGGNGGAKNRKAESAPKGRLPGLAAKRLVIVEPSGKLRSRASWHARADEENVEAVATKLISEIQAKYAQSSDLGVLLYSQEYLAIIGLGPRVVPHLIRDMATGCIPWYWALKAITREPVGENSPPGNFRAVRDAWMQWGKDQGFL